MQVAPPGGQISNLCKNSLEAIAHDVSPVAMFLNVNIGKDTGLQKLCKAASEEMERERDGEKRDSLSPLPLSPLSLPVLSQKDCFYASIDLICGICCCQKNLYISI